MEKEKNMKKVQSPGVFLGLCTLNIVLFFFYSGKYILKTLILSFYIHIVTSKSGTPHGQYAAVFYET